MKIKCPACQAVLNIPAEAAGKVVKCPCGKQLRAPAAPANTGPKPSAASGSPKAPAPKAPAPNAPAQGGIDPNMFDDLTDSDMQPFGKQAQPAHKPNPYQSATSMGPSGTPRAASPAVEAKVKPAAITLLIAMSIFLVLVVIGLIINVLVGGALLAGMAQGGAEIAPDEEAMMMFQGIWGIATSVIALICGIVIIIGSVKMMRMQSYGFAMTACILAMLPITSPCCCLGLPIGIWGIVVLCDPQVKAAFA